MIEARELMSEIEADPGGEWALDPAHSSVEFVSRYMMISKVRGRFGDVAGVIRVGDSVEDAEVDVVIGAASIDTSMPMRDEHLRSPDFLDVERFPHIRFRSLRGERTGPETGRIEGELTIRDVTRPVTLDVSFEGLAPEHDGGVRAAFSAKGSIDREEFGITWNRAIEAGGMLVGPKVGIEIEAMLIRQAEVS